MTTYKKRILEYCSA